MAIDILDWDQDPGYQEFGLTARADTTELTAYIGEIDVQRGSPARLRIWSTPPGAPLGEELSITLDPAKAYRLVFSGVGSLLTLQLFDLADLVHPLEQLRRTDTVNTQGAVGLWVWTPDGAYDLTVDNFIVRGTSPMP